ncbi:sulfotransferase [Nodosilinea sp. FACHB-13]|uniref:sulfotransferase family protein n=1 Tax=Cyanophyceae TaxID=3028117 RepID=UPI0021024D01|nr:sulfotransferase [Nodosilinea sp. FACHB-13]
MVKQGASPRLTATSAVDTLTRGLSTQRPLVKSPFFICCSGRSGSTHLRLMLDHHPQLSCVDEVGYITELVSDDGDMPDVATYRQWLESDFIFQSCCDFTIDPDLDFYELVNDFLCQQKDCSNKQAVGAISHFDFIRLLKLWPDARFIHMVRDGRDVAYSWMKEMHLFENPWFAAEKWREAEQAWERLAQRLPEGQYLEITYEDMVNDTVGTLTEICQFLGVDYDAEMLKFSKAGSYFTLPDPKFSGLWRSHLSPWEIQVAEANISDLLIDRGYKLSELPRLTVSSLDLKRFKLMEKVFMWQRRISFFGLRLSAVEYLSRRLGLRGWHSQVKQEMHAIAIPALKR